MLFLNSTTIGSRRDGKIIYLQSRFACCSDILYRISWHYPNKCWLLTRWIHWYSHKSNVAASALATNLYKVTLFKSLPHLPGPNKLTNRALVTLGQGSNCLLCGWADWNDGWYIKPLVSPVVWILNFIGIYYHVVNGVLKGVATEVWNFIRNM